MSPVRLHPSTAFQTVLLTMMATPFLLPSQSHPQLDVTYLFILFLWLHLIILSGAISLLISSSILGIYRPGDFIFQCPIFLPFQNVCGVLKLRILKLKLQFFGHLM